MLWRVVCLEVYITHMDEIVDHMLRESTVFEVDLPCLLDRRLVEETYGLPPYISTLEAELALEETIQNSREQFLSSNSDRDAAAHNKDVLKKHSTIQRS